MRTDPITIPLAKPLLAHGGKKITQIVLRPPTFDEYMRLGDPFIWIPLEDGRAYRSDSNETLAEYARILVKEPDDELLLVQGGFPLARQIRSAVTSFFLPDDEATKV